MTMDEKLDAIAEAASKLASILQANEVGLFSWQEARIRLMRDLLKATMTLSIQELVVFGVLSRREAAEREFDLFGDEREGDG